MKATKPQTEDGHRVTSWDDHDHQHDDDPTTSDRTNWDDDPTQSGDDEWAGADYREQSHNDHTQHEYASWD